jgi:hypothetical protein
MKKLILSTLAIFAFSVSQAQTNDGASFGIKGGINFSNLYTEDVDDNNVLTSFHAGIFISLPLTSFIAIQPEFLYSRKGAELVYDNAFAQGTAKFRLNYLEVPVLLKLNITENLNFQAGPYFAYLIDADIKNESAGGGLDFQESFNNDDFNKFDYGLAIGAGFDFDTFGFGIRYNYGLANVGKERDFAGTTYTFPDAKNSNLSLFAAIRF